MATIAKTIQLSAQTARRRIARNIQRRGFHISSQDRAAQNYTMPALSPTMTEGNIATWRVKEGESFSAGDVLLEIETDKATMDVEAQDDGVLMKITSSDGSKGIKVGTRIAVTAEPGDDINSLDMPAEEQTESKSQEREQRVEEVTKSTSKSDTTEPNAGQQKSRQAKDASKIGERPQKQKFQLSAAVEALLHQNGLSAVDADSIRATGPKGRLLKGDVLAHLGKIDKGSPARLEKHVTKLAHLDLSNIQLAKKPDHEAKGVEAKEQGADVTLRTATEVAMPISLSFAIATQKRVQDSLGIFLPLSTFIARASELANDDLPLSTDARPTADDLFNAVLGLKEVAKSSRGHYIPQVSGIYTDPSSNMKSRMKPDIIDLLVAKPPKPSTKSAKPVMARGIPPDTNIFSVTAKSGDERRAEKYLGRMKIALEQEPGRLIL